MIKWPLIAAISVALISGGAIFATQSRGKDIPEAATENEQREDVAASAEAMAARAAIADDPFTPKHEPAGYDVSIITFADYQCPYCRKLHLELERLAQTDDKIRIVYRDWPIFGPASEEAARAAIASQWQGKHAAFNDQLMRTQGKLSSETIRSAADSAGVDWAQLQKDIDTRKVDIDAVLGRTNLQAAQMGLQGTPALLIGPYMVPGAIDYEGLAKGVALAREFNARHPAPAVD